jgi:hypothetical protein
MIFLYVSFDSISSNLSLSLSLSLSICLFLSVCLCLSIDSGQRVVQRIAVHSRSLATRAVTAIPLGNDVVSLASRASTFAHSTVSEAAAQEESSQKSFLGSLATWVSSASAISRNVLSNMLGSYELQWQTIGLSTGELQYHMIELDGRYGGFLTLGLLMHPPYGVVSKPQMPLLGVER